MRGMTKQACVFVLLLGVFCGVNQSLFGEDENRTAENKIYTNLLASTVFIVNKKSMGTGVIVGIKGVNDDGREKTYYEIITNHHVVADLDSPHIPGPFYKYVDVYFPIEKEGRGDVTYETDINKYLNNPKAKAIANVWYTRPEKDLAYLTVMLSDKEKERVPGASIINTVRWTSFGNIKDPRAGDPVYSIGNPLGVVRDTLWVSSKGDVRSVTTIRAKKTKFGPLNVRAVVTSAPINPGDSGGPVVNGKGDLVGINSSSVASVVDPSTLKIREARLVTNVISGSEITNFLKYARKHKYAYMAKDLDIIWAKYAYYKKAHMIGLARLTLHNSRKYLDAELTRELEKAERLHQLTSEVQYVRFYGINGLSFTKWIHTVKYYAPTENGGYAWVTKRDKISVKKGHSAYLRDDQGQPVMVKAIQLNHDIIWTRDGKYRKTTHGTQKPRYFNPNESSNDPKRRYDRVQVTSQPIN